MGDSVHDAKSDINRRSHVLQTRDLPDTSPEMEGCQTSGELWHALVAGVRFHSSVTAVSM